MRDQNKKMHSILTVSFSEQFAAAIKRALPAFAFRNFDVCKNAASARQLFFERYYDLVVINFPLPDETGTELVYDIAEKTNAGILLAVPPEISGEVKDRVVDEGVMVISKPVQDAQIKHSLRFLAAVQDRMHRLEQEVLDAHEKMEELRTVSKAKSLLMAKKNMTEDEAHRYIGKEAMNNSVSRRKIAQRILDELE